MVRAAGLVGSREMNTTYVYIQNQGMDKVFAKRKFAGVAKIETIDKWVQANSKKFDRVFVVACNGKQEPAMRLSYSVC